MNGAIAASECDLSEIADQDRILPQGAAQADELASVARPVKSEELTVMKVSQLFYRSTVQRLGPKVGVATAVIHIGNSAPVGRPAELGSISYDH